MAGAVGLWLSPLLTTREMESWDEPDGRSVLVLRLVAPAGEGAHLKNLGEQVLLKVRADRDPKPPKRCHKTMDGNAAAVALGLRCGVDEQDGHPVPVPAYVGGRCGR